MREAKAPQPPCGDWSWASWKDYHDRYGMVRVRRFARFWAIIRTQRECTADDVDITALLPPVGRGW